MKRIHQWEAKKGKKRREVVSGGAVLVQQFCVYYQIRCTFVWLMIPSSGRDLDLAWQRQMSERYTGIDSQLLIKDA